MRKLLIFAAVQIALVAGAASPAFAHGGGGPDATNFSSVVNQVKGVGPGIVWSIKANDALLNLENRGESEVTIFGYSDEPYLRIGPKGVFENQNSPATYLNVDRFGAVDVPSGVSSTAEPKWRKISSEPSHGWHDHRIHWMSQTLPPQVAADNESKKIKIFDWAVPFSVNGQRFEVTGTLNWIRADSPLPHFLVGLLATTLPLVGAFFSKPAGPERKRALKRTFALVLAVLVVLDIVHSVDDILAVPATLTENLSAGLQSGLFIALGAYGARWAWKAKEGAWIGILLGTIGVALGIGATHLVTLTSSQIATTLPPAFSRYVLAANVSLIIPAGLLAWYVHEKMVVEASTQPVVQP